MIDAKKNIILIGGGGHCKSCIDVIESTGKYNVVGILDLPFKLGDKVLDYEVIGNDNDYLKFKNKGYAFFITAGQIKSSKLRKKIFDDLENINAAIETIISPKATVSKYATIEKGSIVMHHSIVNAGAVIKENCIINNGAIIEHDTVINQHTHISTNAVINGDVVVGSNSFIGSNACVSNGVNIIDNCIIGAGSTVISDLLEAGTYVGSPSKKLNDE